MERLHLSGKYAAGLSGRFAENVLWNRRSKWYDLLRLVFPLQQEVSRIVLRHYSKILVPYDGTISTEQTMRTACRIARWNESHVLVAVPFFSQDDKGGLKESIVSGVNLIARQEKIEMDVLFQDGRPSDAIIDVSQKMENDLIVLGKVEMTALEKFVVGSFTGRIIGHAKCDIIVVPEEAPVRWWNRILLCADGSRYSAEAVENAILYARKHEGAINVISVVDLTDEFYALSPEGADSIILKSQKTVADIIEKARNDGVSAESFVREGEVADKILETATETRASIIFMGSHERTGIMGVFMGSVARKVAMRAECPVFIIKP